MAQQLIITNRQRLSENRGFRLLIYIEREMDLFIKVQVFSETKQKLTAIPRGLLSPVREAKYLVEGGTYTIRVSLNGVIYDNEVIIQEDVRYQVGSDHYNYLPLRMPKLVSSVPLKHQLYENADGNLTQYAVKYSMVNSFEGLEQPTIPGQGLFIFLRFPSAKVYQQFYKKVHLWSKFHLYNGEGKHICKLKEYAHRHHETFLGGSETCDFLAFTADLKPGQYFLRYNGEEKREIPIYVYEGWFTQFFMMVTERPLFETIRVLLEDEKSFKPNNQHHAYIDICLDQIQNSDFHIKKDLINIIAWGKYSSPMLGLLGAYLYLKSPETKENELFRNIVRNLQEKILVNNGGSADIWALNLLSYEHFNEIFIPEERTSIEGTPMLRIGYDTIRRSASKYDWLVSKNSLNDLIAEKQVFDSPFNTFTPVKKPKIGASENFNVQDFDLTIDTGEDDGMLGASHNYLAYDETVDLKTALDTDLDNVDPFKVVHYYYHKPIKFNVGRTLQKSKEDLYSRLLSEPEKLGFVGYSIVLELQNNKNASSRDIAQKINMPISTVDRIRQKWKL
jgi:hypothetical protein